jgi:hypothetical protein
MEWLLRMGPRVAYVSAVDFPRWDKFVNLNVARVLFGAGLMTPPKLAASLAESFQLSISHNINPADLETRFHQSNPAGDLSGKFQQEKL